MIYVPSCKHGSSCVLNKNERRIQWVKFSPLTRTMQTDHFPIIAEDSFCSCLAVVLKFDSEFCLQCRANCFKEIVKIHEK